MKKSKIAVIIAIGVAAMVTAGVCVTAVALQSNSNHSPTPNVHTASEPEKSTVPTEKEAARSEIKKTLAEKRDALRQQMMADGKDSKEAAFDAEVQTALEQAAETADILKKYGKVDETFSITNVEDNLTGMKAACELLNGSESITVKEQATLELYLEENYYVLPELGNQQELMKEIQSTVSLPF